jgi:hypothetical protein
MIGSYHSSYFPCIFKLIIVIQKAILELEIRDNTLNKLLSEGLVVEITLLQLF